MAYADQRETDGLERWRTRKIDARLATIEDDLDSGAIGGGGGGGGGEAGGWTYIFQTSDHTNSTATPTDVPGLAFTPSANKRYEIEGRFFTRAAATTTGAQVGVVWPSGIVAPSACRVMAPSSFSAMSFGIAERGVSRSANATGSNSTTLESLVTLDGIITTGGSPSGTFKIRLDSEVAASEARMVAGSFIRYREIPTS
jgi:hypothetical protein